MKNKREPIGRVIRRERRMREMSQGELARRAGLSRQALIALETGKADTRLANVERVAKVLGLEIQVGGAQRSAA